MLRVVIMIQLVTFVVAGAVFIERGEVRLGSAQMLLAGVQAIIYT